MLTKFQIPDAASIGNYVTEFFADLDTKEIIRRHLLNINHRITDEDIKQVKTEMQTANAAPYRAENNFQLG